MPASTQYTDLKTSQKSIGGIYSQQSLAVAASILYRWHRPVAETRRRARPPPCCHASHVTRLLDRAYTARRTGTSAVLLSEHHIQGTSKHTAFTIGSRCRRPLQQRVEQWRGPRQRCRAQWLWTDAASARPSHAFHQSWLKFDGPDLVQRRLRQTHIPRSSPAPPARKGTAVIDQHSAAVFVLQPDALPHQGPILSSGVHRIWQHRPELGAGIR